MIPCIINMVIYIVFLLKYFGNLFTSLTFCAHVARGSPFWSCRVVGNQVRINGRHRLIGDTEGR